MILFFQVKIMLFFGKGKPVNNKIYSFVEKEIKEISERRPDYFPIYRRDLVVGGKVAHLFDSDLNHAKFSVDIPEDVYIGTLTQILFVAITD